MSNKTTLAKRFRNVARSAKFHAATGGMALSASPFLVMAQDDFDASAITSKIVSNGAIAVGIIGALILAGWGVRSMGLLRGRG